MKPIKGTGTIIDLTCDTASIPEFPNLLFGTHFDKGIFFDASLYLKDFPQLSVSDFFDKFSFIITKLSESYNLEESDLVVINRDGHQLLNGKLCYPFISYTDQQFCVYIVEILEELFTYGFVISDTSLISLVKNRYSKELLKQLFFDEENFE